MDYVALAKDLGGPAALLIVVAMALGRAGFFRWLHRAHQAVSGVTIAERAQLSKDEQDIRAELRADKDKLRSLIDALEQRVTELQLRLTEERDQCNRRIGELEDRHDNCERRLADMDKTMQERDRVRRQLAREVLDLRQAAHDHGIAVSDDSRLAELILAEEAEAVKP